MSTPGMERKTTFSARIRRLTISATMAVVAEADHLRAQGVDLADFGAGEPHFATPRHIKEAGIAAIHNNFSKYTPVAGTAELRQAIVRRHAQDFGSAYAREETIASVGGKHALFNVLQVLVSPGDEVIIPVPFWVSFKDMVEYGAGRCVFLPTGEDHGFRLTAAMVERALTPKTKIILLNSPNNPSGAVVPPEEQEKIARLAAARGIWLLSDECYVYLNYAAAPFSLGTLRQYKDSMVLVGSLSKTYAMTGWRLGFALAPAPVVKQLQKLQSHSTSSPSSISQKAAVAALNGPQQCVAEMRADYLRRRDLTLAGLREIPGLKVNQPDGAFYVYPNVSAYFGARGMKSASDVAARLLHQAHVVVVPGEAFGTREHVRMSYATSEQEIRRGLERMKTFFAGL